MPEENAGRRNYQSFRTIGARGKACFSDAFAVPQNVFKQQARGFQTLRRDTGKTSAPCERPFLKRNCQARSGDEPGAVCGESAKNRLAICTRVIHTAKIN